jgi:NAD(P)-dependent dehydrogenase (short-subunit alcohol dehydrogenase family)
MNRFQGKTAIITGGTTGIGFATAKLLISEGGKVGVTGRTPASIQAARQELGAGNHVWHSDSGKLSDIESLAKDAKQAFGHIDLLFINAGVGKFLPLDQVTEANWDETFAINLKGAFFAVQKLSGLIRSGGSVVLTTTIANEKGMPGSSFYAASKAGLRSLARTLAGELLAKGIRVNAVSPGPIHTPILDKVGLSPDQKAGFVAHMTESNPMKRFGSSEEVARAVLFLAMDATYSTGIELCVDGGAGQL